MTFHFLPQQVESRLCSTFAASTPVYQAILITLLHSSCLLSAVTWIRLNPFESVGDGKNAHSCCTYFSKRVVFVVHFPRQCCSSNPYFPRQCCPSNLYLLRSCIVIAFCQLWHWSVFITITKHWNIFVVSLLAERLKATQRKCGSCYAGTLVRIQHKEAAFCKHLVVTCIFLVVHHVGYLVAAIDSFASFLCFVLSFKELMQLLL